jgi:16S rRNA (guanine(527)-N(7))-methyltransferase RsmG
MEQSGISLNSEAADRLLTYLAVLEKWNAKINLTSSTEWRGIKPLFQEGIWAAEFYQDVPTAHLDIGSGAGFPAMLLRILKQKMQLDMVESRTKRCVFLETLINLLKLDGAKVHCMRLDKHLQSNDRVWDCVTWKAIKLKCEDIERLLLHSHQRTQFWMFHGKQLAVEEPGMLERSLKLVRTEEFDRERSWFLSIYLPRHAFHVKQFSDNSASRI